MKIQCIAYPNETSLMSEVEVHLRTLEENEWCEGPRRLLGYYTGHPSQCTPGSILLNHILALTMEEFPRWRRRNKEKAVLPTKRPMNGTSCSRKHVLEIITDYCLSPQIPEQDPCQVKKKDKEDVVPTGYRRRCGR